MRCPCDTNVLPKNGNICKIHSLGRLELNAAILEGLKTKLLSKKIKNDKLSRVKCGPLHSGISNEMAAFLVIHVCCQRKVFSLKMAGSFVR